MDLMQMLFGAKQDPRLVVAAPKYNPQIPIRAFQGMGQPMTEEDAYLQGLLSQRPESLGGTKSVPSALMQALSQRGLMQRMNQLKGMP